MSDIAVIEVFVPGTGNHLVRATGSTAERLLADRFAERQSVENWRRNIAGALLDDTQTLQAAIAAVQTGTGSRRLHLLGGGYDYEVEETILISVGGVELIGGGGGNFVNGGLANILATAQTHITMQAGGTGPVVKFESLPGTNLQIGGGASGIMFNANNIGTKALHLHSWANGYFFDIACLRGREDNLLLDTVTADVLEQTPGVSAGFAACLQNQFYRVMCYSGTLSSGPGSTARMIRLAGHEDLSFHNAPNCLMNTFRDIYVMAYNSIPIKLEAAVDNTFYGVRGGSILQAASPTPYLIELCSGDQDSSGLGFQARRNKFFDVANSGRVWARSSQIGGHSSYGNELRTSSSILNTGTAERPMVVIEEPAGGSQRASCTTHLDGVPQKRLEVVGGFHKKDTQQKLSMVVDDVLLEVPAANSATFTAVGIIPKGALLIGVSTQVITNLGPPAVNGYKVGDGVDDDRWGVIEGRLEFTASGASDFTSGAITLYTTPGDVVITQRAEPFDTGAIRIFVHYLLVEGFCDGINSVG